MKQDKIKTLTWAGLMCAIVVVTTMFAAIPIPGVQGAYANAGDAAVYASAHLLGWPWGVAAAAIGSMLAVSSSGQRALRSCDFCNKGRHGAAGGKACRQGEGDDTPLPHLRWSDGAGLLPL